MKYMGSNVYTNRESRSFFYYEGDFYINGTEIAIKDSYINNLQYNGKKYGNTHTFIHKLMIMEKFHIFSLKLNRTGYHFI